ncbi:MAG: hypothetical protein NC341_12980 [Blautia sp.]|nr:hypothetical protein [Blautia sp.]MCM1202422.1 hypothetical protein [Bacteroides fragilis]
MGLRERMDQLLNGEGGNYIFPFFWQHGEEESVLREYMQKIQEANINAVCVESRPHPDFAKAGWWKDMDVILDEAGKRNMKVWILDDEHFPTGYAAGAMEHADKELCHQYLDYNVLESWGPRPQMEIRVGDYAKPQPLPPWMPPMPGEPARKHHDDRLLRVLACPVEEMGKIGKPVDLTEKVEGERLLWDVPAGYWKIYVIYLTYDARGRNNYINFLDEASCRILIDAVYEPHYECYKELFGTVIAGFFSDEPPIGNTPGYTRGDLIGNPQMALPWSKAMQGKMRTEYGEGWEQELPYLWNEGSDGHRTARIRTAYMNAVSRLVSACFSDQLGKWCEEHGVEYIGHMLEDCDSNANLGPSMGHFFRGLSGQHMAGIDNIGGQVLPGGQDVHRHEPDMCQDSAGFYHYMLGRMGASMAAVDPKKKGRCMCENFGAYGWRSGVSFEKYLMDHFLVRGVNRFVPHAFSPKEFPDPDCPPHFYAHGENPQFRAFGALMAYTGRICHLIDGGIQEAPVALLYHGESQWGGAYESNIRACRVLTEHQIGFLIIPADILADGAESNTVFLEKEGCLRVNGIDCRALVISGCAYLPKAAAEFAVRAQKSGFKVVFTGRLPEGISDADAETSGRLVEALRSCRVVRTEHLEEEFADSFYHTAVPEHPVTALTAYHYRNEGDVYLLLNENTADEFAQWVAFPGLPEGSEVWAYDAWRNRLRPARVRRAGTETEVMVELQPLEMMVLVCGALENMPADAYVGALRKEPAEGLYLKDFRVTRCEAKAYPDFTGEEQADLIHGMALAHPEFSGIYRYETTVSLEGWKRAELELQEVYDSAEVFVNGVSAGILAAKPYRFPIDDMVKDGENHIRIEAATTLERKAAAMGIGDGGMGTPTPLAPSGIIGDIILKRYDG